MDKNGPMIKYESGTNLVSMERKFIKLYKQLSHLWNPNHPDYNNRYRRNAGYDVLLPVYRQYMPKATRFHIRQKINILRSCYRKELRKHLASRSIDPDGNVIFTYIPGSWKFNALRFLDCDEDAENEIDNSEIDLPEYEDEPELEFVENAEVESVNDEPDTSKRQMSPLYVDEEKTFSRKRVVSNSYKSEEDVLDREFNAIGSNVACKLQRMSVQQRYHAELLINKVLINGLKEQLTEETDLSHEVEGSSNKSRRKIVSKEDSLDSSNSPADQGYRINDH